MPRKKPAKREEPEEAEELDPEVEVFLDHLASIIIRIKTEEAAGHPSTDASSEAPPVAKRKGRSKSHEPP